MGHRTTIATVFHSASLEGTLSRLVPELRLVPVPPLGGGHHCSAVVVELEADGEDPLALLAHLVETSNGTPVVALSRSADPGRVARVLSAGAYDYVLLPLGLPRLKNALLRAVEHAVLRLELEARPAPEARLPTLELASLERLAIEEALRETSNNFAEAAKLLGLGRSTLYRRVSELAPARAPAARAAKKTGRPRRRRGARATT